MSASQFPPQRVEFVSVDQPMLPVQNLRYVAQMLFFVDELHSTAANPAVALATQMELRHLARQHVAALAAYTQPWRDLAD